MFRAVLALILVLAAAAPASAATRNRITPLAPTAGATVPKGKAPVFRLRASGPGQVRVRICTTSRRDESGVICAVGPIGRAKKRDGVFEHKPRFFDFPDFWLNSPGTYYWQAYRVYCNSRDCRQEGPVVKFRVA